MPTEILKPLLALDKLNQHAERHLEALDAMWQPYNIAATASFVAQMKRDADQKYKTLIEAGEKIDPPGEIMMQKAQTFSPKEWSALPETQATFTPEALNLQKELSKIQIKQAKEAMRNRDIFEYTIGNPTTISCVQTATRVTSMFIPADTLSRGSGAPLSTTGPTNRTSPGSNTASFSAIAPSGSGFFDFSLVTLKARHVFSFNAPILSSGGKALLQFMPFLAPTGTFSMSSPKPTYFFLLGNTDPKARISLDVKASLMMGDFSVPLVIPGITASMSGQTQIGASATRTGLLGDVVNAGSAVMMQLPKVLVSSGTFLTVAIDFTVQMFASEGGVAAISGGALNTPSMWVMVET